MVDEQRPKKLVGYYQHPPEAERDHPGLDRNAPMRKSEFDDITAQYEFPEAEYVTCQLEREDKPGELCQQSHGRGWIMRNAAGVEGYIGGHCAADHFKAHTAFSGATAKARRDVSLQKTKKRLEALLSDQESLRARIRALFERARELRDSVKAIREKLPYKAKERLQHAAKTGNRSITLEFATRVKVEDEKKNVREVTKWRSDIIGAVAAPNALDTTRLQDIVGRLRMAQSALDYGEASLERKETEMREWAEALEGIDRCGTELEELTADLELFKRMPNVSLLCWLCTSDEDQLACARVALQCTSGAATISNTAVRKARSSWYDEIVREHQGRPFRVPS